MKDNNKNDNKDTNKDKKKKSELYLTIILSIAIVLITIVGIVMIYKHSQNKSEEKKDLPYTELITSISEKKVEKIEMTVASTTVKVKLKDVEEEKTAIVPSTQAFIELVQEEVKNGNEIELIQNPTSILLRTGDTILTLIPTILIIVLVGLVLKMQGLGDKGKVYDAESDENTNTTFEDVAGLEEEKSELIEIVDFLKEPKKFHDMGAKIPKGILLCGKPRNSAKH